MRAALVFASALFVGVASALHPVSEADVRAAIMEGMAAMGQKMVAPVVGAPEPVGMLSCGRAPQLRADFVLVAVSTTC
jgi:hypothetical protein